MKILAFAASLRKQSHNAQLLEVAVALARHHGAEVTVRPFSAYDMPFYNEDAQQQAFPAGAQALHEDLVAADGILIASPEYNASMPGSLKNAIDWVSRYRPIPFRGKQVLLLSTSISPAGGNRGLWQLRVPLEALGAHVFPEMFSLHHVEGAIEGQRLANAVLQERLELLVERYLAYVKALHGALPDAHRR